MSALRLVFMGTPDFSVPALHALIAAGHEIAAVYSQPPRPAGRGKKLTPTPVHRAADAAGLEVRTPTSLKSAEEADAFAALNADAAVVVAYGLILPKAILDAAKLGCLNIHASLLPRWRGAAPIQRALLAGDAETGVCIMAMDEGLDTGSVLSRHSLPIGPRETAGDLHDRLSTSGADAITETLAALDAGTTVATPQPGEGVTYAAKLEKSEGRINWALSAEQLDRQIRALTPWPGCFFELPEHLGGARAKVLEAVPFTDNIAADSTATDKTTTDKTAANNAPENASPATILDSRTGTIACGSGALTITRAQRPGGKPVTGPEFLAALGLKSGDSLT